jgi:dihydrodipicolinate synthase/N-acetylneuraminate lyase
LSMTKTSIPYKDTHAAKGSELYKALEEGDMKKAKAVYDATTERMKFLASRRNSAIGAEKAKA